MRFAFLLSSLVPVFLSTGCGSGVEPIVGCEAVAGIRPICGLQNPEDLALLPGGRFVLVSQFGGMGPSTAGSIVLFDVDTESVRVLHPTAEDGSTPDVASGPRWGDPGCPPPTLLSPHGIDLSTRLEGALQLLVVNHGERESVEFFEVDRAAESVDVTWRGCAIPPEGTLFNDIVALPSGGFVATHMFERHGGMFTNVSALLGMDTGKVLEWRPGEGFTDVPGTKAPTPNGIEISPDGDTLFVNSYSGGEVRRINRHTGKITGRAELPLPDNLTWSDDGRLLVASHTGSFSDMIACNQIESGTCPLAFQIVALHPETMETEVLLANEGPPMGAATVALQVGPELLLGTFSGDRIARVALD